MNNEITSTHEIAENHWNGSDEDGGVRTDMVATKEPEGRGIEFAVSMRDYTLRDMEDLIVGAAARTIVGRHNDRELARKIEAKCIELIDAKATDALAKVTTEIVDQPLTPQFVGQKDPITMREFIGLYGREYLAQHVDRDGKPCPPSSYNNTAPRIERIIAQYLDRKFKAEIEKATSAAIAEIQNAIRTQHAKALDAEKARVREALSKVSS
jgi:hypothetical protein